MQLIRFVTLSHWTEERRQRELLYKAERKKQHLQLEVEQRKAKQEFKQQKQLRSYSYVLPYWRNLALNWSDLVFEPVALNFRSLMLRDNIDAGAKLTAAADLSSVNAYEEDFM